MRVVYVAGPFRAIDGWEVACNVHRAEEAGREIAEAQRLGMPVFLPLSDQPDYASLCAWLRGEWPWPIT